MFLDAHTGINWQSSNSFMHIEFNVDSLLTRNDLEELYNATEGKARLQALIDSLHHQGENDREAQGDSKILLKDVEDLVKKLFLQINLGYNRCESVRPPPNEEVSLCLGFGSG